VAERDMVSTISFIQTKLQHRIAVSRVLTRTAVDKGIDKALKEEAWYREGYSMGLIDMIGYDVI